MAYVPFIQQKSMKRWVLATTSLLSSVSVATLARLLSSLADEPLQDHLFVLLQPVNVSFGAL